MPQVNVNNTSINLSHDKSTVDKQVISGMR